MSMEIYEQQLAESARQERRLYELADQMARECPWMWGRGDDVGGSLWQVIQDAYMRHGLLPEIKPVISAKKQNRPKISAQKSLQVFSADGYRCVRCGSQDDLTVDHITPVSAGGGNDLSNLQTLCRPCNSKKGAKING